jgi:hypothetical protein
MGAGASINNFDELQQEYDRVKPTLSQRGAAELDRTFNDLMTLNHGESFVIGACREKFNEIQLREIFERQTQKPAWARNEEKECEPSHG